VSYLKDPVTGLRLLTADETRFKRKSMLKRLDQVIEDVDEEFGNQGSVYMLHMAHYRLSQLYIGEGGC